MTVNPVAATTSTSSAAATSTAASSSNPLQSLTDPNTFLNLLVAQLKYQDPLNPTSGTQFLSQTAQLTEVETMSSLESQVSAEATSQATMTSTSMIGKQISATLADGTAVTGVVQRVALDAKSGPTLNVNGTTVPLSDVTSVTNAAAAASTATSTSSAG